MRALITGAFGFCGQHLTRHLKEQGIEVYTLGNKEVTTQNHYHVTDVTDINALIGVLKAAQPDYIFHLAGIIHAVDPTLFYRVNTQYAVALLHAIRSVGMDDCPVLLAGTSAEYGEVTEENLPIREDFSPRPYNHYGISKLAQTLEGLVASRNGHPVIIVRPFNIIGPGMPDYLVLQSFAMQVMRIMKGQMPPVIEVGNLKSSRDFIDVSDVVKIYWQLIRTPSAYGEIINVCSGRATVIGDLLSKLIELSGIHIEVRSNPSRFKTIDVPVHYGSTEKLQRILGSISNTSLDGTLKHIMEELKDQI